MILICFDGSADARTAIEKAGGLFAEQRATVLTIWEPFSALITHSSFGVMPMAFETDTDAFDRSAREQAEKMAAEGVTLTRAVGLDAQSAVCPREDDVAASIVGQAAAIQADVIVMGTRGLRGVKSLLLGSVSSGVLQQADRPVMVIPSAEVASERGRRLSGRD
jgi:nucleotide-binding universal stress UspA family protein